MKILSKQDVYGKGKLNNFMSLNRVSYLSCRLRTISHLADMAERSNTERWVYYFQILYIFIPIFLLKMRKCFFQLLDCMYTTKVLHKVGNIMTNPILRIGQHLCMYG